MSQLQIKYSGKELKEKGIKRAIDNAERVNPGWKETAYWYFKYWIRYQDRPFKLESFREWCKDLIPPPPSLRAFGGVVQRAKKENLIRHVGFTQVENPKAHHANASLWQRI